MVKIFPFEKFHGKPQTGSGDIRVRNLLKHWPEADVYKYGDDPEVLIFQKVYCTRDFNLPETYPGIKILDICDPDWTEIGVYMKRTVDAMDAIVCPTQGIKEFLEQMTSTPVHIIKDRFDTESYPDPVEHTTRTKNVVWFGYSHNAVILRDALVSLEKRGLKLTVISDFNPMLDYHMDNPDLYEFVQYDSNIYEELQKHDVCILPYGTRPEDRFKSENKDIISRLLGLPVAKTANELDNLMTPEEREQEKLKWYDYAKEEYDSRKSVREYKELIDALTQAE